MLDLGIKGRKAIVCASNRGLGRACATSLARAGCEVIVNGINAEQLPKTAAEIAKATGAKVTPIVADVTTAEGQKALLAACPEPDILVNNAGGPPFKDFRELNRDAMLKGVVANMVSPIELIQAVIDGMVARKFGRVVNITSGSVKMPLAGLDLSSGARAGLTAFLAGVARSVAHANVTINNLLPGAFHTDRLMGGITIAAKAQNRSVDDVFKERAAGIPAKRVGNPAEFGDACAFLCGANAGFITGQNLLIDGGAYHGTL
jgi:3-oxoacyl-[acyl-carrier protein] reductase